MDWRKGSYINQYYKNNEHLLDRSLVEDIEIFMVENFEGNRSYCSWYDRIFILELEYKLLNESKNYRKNLTHDARFRISETIIKCILRTYNNGLRYRDVEYHITQSIENHKEKLERYRGYGHYGYIGYIWH
jgi:predicted ATP-binding protein involved in virulence